MTATMIRRRLVSLMERAFYFAAAESARWEKPILWGQGEAWWLRARIGAIRRETPVRLENGEQIGQLNHPIPAAGRDISTRTGGGILVTIEDAKDVGHVEKSVGVGVAVLNLDGPAGAGSRAAGVVQGAELPVVAGCSIGKWFDVAIPGYAGIGGAGIFVVTIGVKRASPGGGRRLGGLMLGRRSGAKNGFRRWALATGSVENNANKEKAKNTTKGCPRSQAPATSWAPVAFVVKNSNVGFSLAAGHVAAVTVGRGRGKSTTATRF